MVYKQYNQAQLNDQYNTRLQVPDYADYFERWEKRSREVENEHTVLKNIFYGTHPEECMDIFPAKAVAKTMVFIHGGFWHLLDKALFHFIAASFLKYNITAVFINYPLAPAASMDMISASCRKAIRWLHDNIIQFNGDPEQIYIMGHSAGAHLASMLLVEIDMYFIRAVISLSGLFRLEPLMLSNWNEILGMDKETATRNSPVLSKPLNYCPLLLAVGATETEEFIDQSREIYDLWKNTHSRVELLEIEGKNHYSILEAVTEKDSALQSAIFRLMKIL